MKKRLFASVLVCIILTVNVMPIFGTNKGASAGDFSDVSSNHWAYDAITWMFDNNIVEGAGNGQFLPNRSVSRDEYAKMMVLTLKLDLINPDQPSFLDIKKGSWQYKYVETAKSYMTGFRTSAGDYFRPSQKAVREDMAVALVKALGFEDESADLNLLSQFSDASTISTNLKKYVAIAVKHELMEGYDKNGKRIFGAKEGLDRASAATLLYNAFKENEEKITYDDEKVTYDDKYVNLASTDLKIKIIGDKAVLNWDKITSTTFSGYKVVISESDSTPSYPENGYYKYITDPKTTSVTVKAGDSYNGGDIGGCLKSGVNYYFSITALYGDNKAAGNVVRAKLPAIHEEENEDSDRASDLRVRISGDKALLTWERIDSSKFEGYKVVISKSDSTPKYPDNGYMYYITDKNTTNAEVTAGDSYNGGDFGGTLESNVYYYFSITVLYSDGKVAGNTVKVKLP